MLAQQEKILLAEDDASLAMMMKDTLEEEGFQVSQAKTFGIYQTVVHYNAAHNSGLIVIFPFFKYFINAGQGSIGQTLRPDGSQVYNQRYKTRK